MQTRPLILFILGLYIFSPTLFTWMVNPNGAWYRPYIIWVVVIVIAYFLQSRTTPNDL